MQKMRLIAASMAVFMALAPLVAEATEREDNEKRDGQSRYELAPLSYLPLFLAGSAQERIVQMFLFMQNVSYVIELTTGVKVTSQDRVDLGGLFGSVFADTYSAENFVRSLEVGTVYNAGNGRLAVAMKGGKLLEEHRIIVFNGDYQYDPQSLPTLQQIEPAHLQRLQLYSLMTELAQYTLTAPLMNLIAQLNNVQPPDFSAPDGLTQAQRETEIPALRKLIVGKVYRGPNNTLLVVIPPAIVLDR